MTDMLPPPTMGMGTKVELLDGNWIVIASPKTIKERQRRPIRAIFERFSVEARQAFSADQVDFAAFQPGDMTLMYEINDMAAAALIIAASFTPDGRPSAEDICDLPGGLYDAVVGEIAPYLGPLMNGVDFDPVPTHVNPDSPTPPSSV